MSRIRQTAREYWFELLVAFLAVAGMVELAVGSNLPSAPTTTLWFAIPAIGILVSTLFAHRRFPLPRRPPTGSWRRRSRSSMEC